MAHTLIASKAVERMFHSDDEAEGLRTSIEKDFMGLPPTIDLTEVRDLIFSLGSTIVQESTMSSAVGIMAIKFEKKSVVKRIYFTYGHTTDSMV